tara:strand:+ start:410 stop:700 length:291 start_codon:yes stop_codon:yes gene_type:complete
MNTQENKLIAEFMGYELIGNTYSKNNGMDWFIEPQYHESWDWLMPVIQKCLIGEAEHSEDVSNIAIKNIYEGICNQDISLAYESVVEFINKYNKNK